MKANIASEYDPEIGTTWYLVDKENQKSEITALRNSLNVSDPPFVVIDNHTIGTIIPMEGQEENDDRLYLGYYRFVLIDVITDTILQQNSLLYSDY